jgi:hypothetical protein
MRRHGQKQRRRAGFTLIEIMIGSAISFTIIGLVTVAMTDMLGGMSRAQYQGQQWDELRHLRVLLTEDLSQIEPHPGGNQERAFTLSQGEGKASIHFRKTEQYRLHQPQKPARVSYVWSKDTEEIRRQIRRPIETEPGKAESSVIVRGVTALKIMTPDRSSVHLFIEVRLHPEGAPGQAGSRRTKTIAVPLPRTYVD